MPPVENWTKVERVGYEHAWKNDATGYELRIYREEDFASPWRAEVYEDGNDGVGVGELVHAGTSGRRARKAAVAWMRSNPKYEL